MYKEDLEDLFWESKYPDGFQVHVHAHDMHIHCVYPDGFQAGAALNSSPPAWLSCSYDMRVLSCST